MGMRIVPVVLAFAFAGAAALAEEDAPPSLAALAFMEGHWVMETADGRAEEIWTSPFDGSIVGLFRWTIPGQMHVLEFLIIEQTESGVIFRFKHFDKNYRAWEVDQPNTYRLAEVEGNRAVFENVDWNGRVPQRMIYTSPAPDRLVFRGESPDAEDDEPLVLEFARKE